MGGGNGIHILMEDTESYIIINQNLHSANFTDHYQSLFFEGDLPVQFLVF